jgi:hypothetical protein
MTDKTKALIEGWWEIHRLTTERPSGHQAMIEDLWWAWEALESEMDDASPGAVQLLVALCEAAPSEEELGSVGAGPLETLIVENAATMATPVGAVLLDAVARASRQSPPFRIALAGVWYETEEVPESVRTAIPGMPPPMDERPTPSSDPMPRRSRRLRRPGRPSPTRRRLPSPDQTPPR